MSELFVIMDTEIESDLPGSKDKGSWQLFRESHLIRKLV